MSDVIAVFCPHRMAHISFAGCLILDFLLTVQVLKSALNFHGTSEHLWFYFYLTDEMRIWMFV